MDPESESTSNAIQSYQYQPLATSTSIRVIDTSVYEAQGKLCCRLFEVDLDSDPSPDYLCVSYTWGNPMLEFDDFESSQDAQWQEMHKILLVQDFESPGAHNQPLSYLNVGKNLHHFLQELRASGPDSSSSYLWIDAICINQSDLKERAAQVELMGRVYSSCREVIIWMGQEGPETKLAFDDMKFLNTVDSSLFSDALAAGIYVHKSFTPVAKVAEMIGLPPHRREEWEYIRTFSLRSWFHRVWTVQESVLPPKGIVWCGKYRLRDFEGVFLIARLLNLYLEQAILHLTTSVSARFGYQCPHEGSFTYIDLHHLFPPVTVRQADYAEPEP